MRLQLNLILCLSLSTLLSGCYRAPSELDELKIPPIKYDAKTEEFLKSIKTCNKTDSEMGLPDSSIVESVVIRDTIESKETASIECDKSEKALGRWPVRQLEQYLTVEAPAEMKEKINFVRIENSRTCSVQSVDAGKDELLEPINVEIDGKLQAIEPTRTTAGYSGKIKIVLSDSTIRWDLIRLIIFDNNNVLTVKYFGKCLKYKTEIDEKLKDANNCAEAELLAEKKILLSAQIERPEVEGVRKVDGCFEK